MSPELSPRPSGSDACTCEFGSWAAAHPGVPACDPRRQRTAEQSSAGRRLDRQGRSAPNVRSRRLHFGAHHRPPGRTHAVERLSNSRRRVERSGRCRRPVWRHVRVRRPQRARCLHRRHWRVRLAGGFYALDRFTGACRWMLATGNTLDTSPAKLLGVTADSKLVDGVLYFGSLDGRLYAVKAS